MSTDEKEKDEVFQKWIEQQKDKYLKTKEEGINERAAMRKKDQKQWFRDESVVMCFVTEGPKDACFKLFENEQRKNRKQRRHKWRNIREHEIRYMPIDLSNTAVSDNDLSDNDNSK